MNRWPVALLALLLGMAALPALAQSKSATPNPALPVALAFTKGTGVYVQAANATVPEKWIDATHAVDVRIAPGGDALAFTLDTTPKPMDLPVRRIAVLDAKGGRPRVLDAIPGSNSFGPVWSPDGKLLLFEHFVGKAWKLAVVGRDGAGFHDVYAPSKDSTLIARGCWSNDSGSFFCFDFENLYQIDLGGRELRRIAFKDCGLEVSSSTCQFRLAPDGRRMLVEVEMEVPDLKNDDYPSPVIFLLDLDSKKARRVSPKGVMLANPEWLKDGLAYLAERSDARKKGIWRVELETGKTDLIVAGAKDPSVSR